MSKEYFWMISTFLLESGLNFESRLWTQSEEMHWNVEQAFKIMLNFLVKSGKPWNIQLGSVFISLPATKLAVISLPFLIWLQGLPLTLLLFEFHHGKEPNISWWYGHEHKSSAKVGTCSKSIITLLPPLLADVQNVGFHPTSNILSSSRFKTKGGAGRLIKWWFPPCGKQTLPQQPLRARALPLQLYLKNILRV